MAIVLALPSPQLRLLGITTVAGNASLANTTANAIRLLDHVGRADLPVAAGAERPLVRRVHFPSDVHGKTGATAPICRRRHGRPRRSMRATSSPSRSPARPSRSRSWPPARCRTSLLLARHPGAARELRRLVLMGGDIGEGDVTAAADFNIWADAEAAQRVFTGGLDLTMVGLDVTHRVLLTPAHGKRMRAAGRTGAVAVAQVLRPQLFETPPCWVEVETASELCRGRTAVARRAPDERPANARVATGVDAEAVLELLVERICSLG